MNDILCMQYKYNGGNKYLYRQQNLIHPFKKSVFQFPDIRIHINRQRYRTQIQRRIFYQRHRIQWNGKNHNDIIVTKRP